MKVAVFSAGNTGLATAVHLSSLGLEPMLYTRDGGKARAIQSHAVRSTGTLDGFWNIPASDDAGRVLAGADLVIVCAWANAHRAIFETIGRAWRESSRRPLRILVFNGNWGAYEAYQAFSEEYVVPEDVTIAEAAGMPYVAQASFDGTGASPVSVHVSGVKSSIEVAYAADHDGDRVIDSFLRTVYGEVRHDASVFATSLAAPNPIIHAPLCLLNMTRIEEGASYRMLVDGFTERTEGLILAVDAERESLAESLGCGYTPIVRQLNGFWGSHYATLRELFSNNPVYTNVRGPMDVSHRFIHEDVPFGISPLVELGRLLDVRTPACEALSAIYGMYFGESFTGPSFDMGMVEALR